VSSRRTGHVQANICHDTQSQHRPVHLPRPGRRCRNSQRYPASISVIRSICAGRSHDETTRWLVNHLQAAVGSIPRWSTRSAPAPTVARHCHPPGVFHQFRPSLAPWSVRDTLMDELSGPEHRRPSCRRPSRHSWGAQGSWPCAAAAAPRMHSFERRGAATDKRPRPNPNSSTTSDRQFVMASMSESTMHRHASQPAPRCSHGGAAAPVDRPRLPATPRRPTTTFPLPKNPWPSRVKRILRSVFILPLLVFD
jgi:hypothetical protein